MEARFDHIQTQGGDEVDLKVGNLLRQFLKGARKVNYGQQHMNNFLHFSQNDELLKEILRLIRVRDP